jgi:hypothetical protein
MNESAFHFCGRWILTTTVFHFPKSTSTGGIPDFFRVCSNFTINLFYNFFKIVSPNYKPIVLWIIIKFLKLQGRNFLIKFYLRFPLRVFQFDDNDCVNCVIVLVYAVVWWCSMNDAVVWSPLRGSDSTHGKNWEKTTSFILSNKCTFLL